MTNKIKIPEGYKENAKGALIPIANIKDIDLCRDKEVKEMIQKAKKQQQALSEFKQQMFDTIGAFVDMSVEQYGVKLGGKKGNVQLTSFDGRQKVTFSISERLGFDERLQAAKALIDECLMEWTEGANDNLKAIVDRAFDADKAGNLSTARILSLRQTKIDDERWLRAMDAISDSIQVTDTACYVRFYEKDETGKFKAISIDLAEV